MNILRNVKPSLISLETSTRTLDKEMLTGVGNLILFIHRECPPSFDIPKVDLKAQTSRKRDELLMEFAIQLGLSLGIDLKEFNIAGLAFMVVDDLNAHVDGFNASGKEDVTIQMNTSIDIDTLPEELGNLIRECFPQFDRYIPFTLILYPRRCVIAYEERMVAIHRFPSLVKPEYKGRKKMMEILMDTGSTYDYNSRFFTQSGYAKRQTEVASQQTGYHSDEAAIDKMVSSLKTYPTIIYALQTNSNSFFRLGGHLFSTASFYMSRSLE